MDVTSKHTQKVVVSTFEKTSVQVVKSAEFYTNSITAERIYTIKITMTFQVSFSDIIVHSGDHMLLTTLVIMDQKVNIQRY